VSNATAQVQQRGIDYRSPCSACGSPPHPTPGQPHLSADFGVGAFLHRRIWAKHVEVIGAGPQQVDGGEEETPGSWGAVGGCVG